MKWKYGALRSAGWSMSRGKHFSLISNLDLPPSAYAIRREPKRSAKCHIQLKFYVLEEWASLYDAVRFAFIVVFARLFPLSSCRCRLSLPHPDKIESDFVWISIFMFSSPHWQLIIDILIRSGSVSWWERFSFRYSRPDTSLQCRGNRWQLFPPRHVCCSSSSSITATLHCSDK